MIIQRWYRRMKRRISNKEEEKIHKPSEQIHQIYNTSNNKDIASLQSSDNNDK